MGKEFERPICGRCSGGVETYIEMVRFDHSSKTRPVTKTRTCTTCGGGGRL